MGIILLTSKQITEVFILWAIQKNTTKPPYYTPEMLDDAVEKREIESNKIILNKKDAENVPENVPENRFNSIIELIKKNTNISMLELSNHLEVNHKTIKRDIAKLKARGLLERIGPAKGGYWKILEVSKNRKDEINKNGYIKINR